MTRMAVAETASAPRAMGITVHTGWGACVVVGGSSEHPEILANTLIEVLGKDERFCYHAAAEMSLGAAKSCLEQLRQRALLSAKQELARVSAQTAPSAMLCAIVAKPGDPGDLGHVLASHPRLHAAEGCFYRDIFRDACGVPVRIIPPSSLDISRVGKVTIHPWGRDQKLAAVAAWSLLFRSFVS